MIVADHVPVETRLGYLGPRKPLSCMSRHTAMSSVEAPTTGSTGQSEIKPIESSESGVGKSNQEVALELEKMIHGLMDTVSTFQKQISDQIGELTDKVDLLEQSASKGIGEDPPSGVSHEPKLRADE